MKTTSSLLALAADIVITSLQKSKGVSHLHVEPAILDAANQGKYRKAVLDKALKVVKLVIYDAEGRPADFGKAYTESRDPYAYESIERNALKRSDALLFAAEIAKSPLRAPLRLSEKSLGKTVEQLDATADRLARTKTKLAEAKGLLKPKREKAIKPLTSTEVSLAKNISL